MMVAMDLEGKKIVMLVSGGIAAYKAADLASRLKKSGAEVRVAMTRSAQEFIAPLTFEAICGQPVYHKLFGQSEAYRMEHIEWARWADVLIAAPATADFLARMAQGRADDAPSTLYLAFDGPVWAAPAMNTKMWDHPATRANVELLIARGVRMIGPGSGPLACGDVGQGRMAEPEEIVAAMARELPASIKSEEAGLPGLQGPLSGHRVLITAGPTREALDPIRFLSNRSSGRMGVELASAVLRRGGAVDLIHGPMSAEVPPGVEATAIENAREMLEAVQARFPRCTMAIFAAAVSNYRAQSVAAQKIKADETLNLQLTRNPDIAAWAGHHRNGHGQLLAGFAAESENLIAEASHKLQEKGLDLIFANPIGVEGVGFAADNNVVTMIERGGQQRESGRMSKHEIAEWILDRIMERLPEIKERAGEAS